MNDQFDAADIRDDGSDDYTDLEREHNNALSPAPSEADVNLSEDSPGDVSTDDEIEACRRRPVVRGEQPLPQYVHTGLPFFRRLPSGPYEVPNLAGNEHSNMYWNEKHPYRIVLGTKFDSKLHVKTAITMWNLRHHRQFRVVESKLRRWHAVCKFPAGTTETGEGRVSVTEAEKASECSWEVSVTQRKHDGMWEIRKWVERHTCEGHRNDRGHANFSSSMIALCVRHQLQEDADYKASAIRRFVHDRFDVTISYKKAWYARRKAIEIVFGGWEESFRQLPSYMAELQSQNPGTIVEWKHNEMLSQGPNKVFRYVFWALGPAIHAFQLAKPVLTIDGTHLRGRFKGKLLVACGFDADKNCLPIAYAVVDEETGDSWEWFLDHVRIHVVKYQRAVCIISDRHKGILKAMRSAEWQKEPQCHHKFCLIHVRKNILQKFKGHQVKMKVWALGVTTQIRKFIRRRRALQDESRGAVKMLNEIKKENWSLCYDD